jgi:Xaa-Pro aminopeptidase
MWALGADRQGFPETGIIVASGPNSAKPHHAPGHRRVAAGEALLIDWGAEVSGYRSDLTRTVFPGSVPGFALQAYPIVEQALQRAAGRLRAGAAMGEIDRAARETITDAGYTEFHYGVGHGVGLAIHEAPWLRANSTDLCEPGMLTTIEPGIYLPDIGGIRIENLYQITRDGSECLGNLPTDLAAASGWIDFGHQYALLFRLMRSVDFAKASVLEREPRSPQSELIIYST